MASISQQTIIIIVLTIIFAGIYGVLIWLIFVEKGKITACESKQSAFCPTVLCNGNTTDNIQATGATGGGRPSNFCFPYAFRLTSPDAKNEPGETRFECNFPLTGEMYTPD